MPTWLGLHARLTGGFTSGNANGGGSLRHASTRHQLRDLPGRCYQSGGASDRKRRSERLSDGTDLRGLRTLGALGHVVLDLLVFLEGAVPGRLDRGEVDEDVRAAVIGCDETKALVRVEPLYGPLSHFAMCPSR